MTKKTSKKSKTKPKEEQRSYRSFRLQKRIKLPVHGLPSVWRNTVDTLQFLYRHKRIFSGMLALHFLFYLFFFRTPAQFTIAELQDLFSVLFDDAGTVGSQVTVATEAFGVKVDDLSAQNPFAIIGVSVISSLAIIWAIRHKSANKKFYLKDPYYNGMNSLFPYMALLFLIILQLTPFTLGATIFSTVTTSVATTGVEVLLLGLLWAGLATISGYWVIVTSFAMYAVTLQGVTPLEALRGMKLRLQHRRMAVFLRAAGFMVLSALTMFALLLLTIYIARDITFLFIDVMFVLMPFLYHTYLYKLYKAVL